MTKNKEFTLLELLVVTAILGILLSLLLPSLKRAREISKSTVCKSNLKQVSVANFTYVKNWGWCAPCKDESVLGGNRWARNKDIQSYLGWDNHPSSTRMPIEYACPSAVDDAPENYIDKNLNWIHTNAVYNHFQLNPGGTRQWFGVRLEWLDHPDELGNVGETRNSWNVSVSTIRNRHIGMTQTNVLYFDGHVKSISRPASQAYNSSPWRDSNGKSLSQIASPLVPF